ncbi:MAG: hypothetical protein HOQ05_01475 [Corynebacteriales bacterium]|nr:hypothetical protein [Mycobacteriales bacterium]
MTDESDRQELLEEPERGTLDWVIANLAAFEQKSRPKEGAASAGSRSHAHSEARRLLNLLIAARKDMGEGASEWRMAAEGEPEPHWVERLEMLANFDELDEAMAMLDPAERVQEQLALRTHVRVLGDGIQPIAIGARPKVREVSDAPEKPEAPRDEDPAAEAAPEGLPAGIRFREPGPEVPGVPGHHVGTWNKVLGMQNPSGPRP